MATATQHDNFDKLSKLVNEAKESCERTYGIWWADTERLRRLEQLQHDAWMELVGAIEEARPTINAEER